MEAKYMKPFSFVFLASLLISSIAFGAPAPTAQKWLVDLEKATSGAVEFNAIGRPSMLKIRGKGGAPKGSLAIEGTAATGALTFDLESLDTGLKLRNEHMKQKYLETSKYGKATLTLTKLSLPENFRAGNTKLEKLPFEGKLSLHGVEKPVSGLATVERNGEQVAVNADFGLKISDYGIATPGYAGITVAEDVNVLVQFAAPLISKQ